MVLVFYTSNKGILIIWSICAQTDPGLAQMTFVFFFCTHLRTNESRFYTSKKGILIINYLINLRINGSRFSTSDICVLIFEPICA